MVAAHHVSRRVWIAVGLIAAAALIAAYYRLGPESGLYPRCMFRQLTGLDCPGCGSQRAIHALLHGHVAEAWGYNAQTDVNSVWLYISYLRKRLRDMGSQAKIASKRSLGYRLEQSP